MKEKFAIIKLGGSQHIVHEGDELEVNNLNKKAGEKFEIEEVLFFTDGKTPQIGNPTLKASVNAEVIAETKGEKVTSQTFKAKSRYRRKVGKRQMLTKIKISKISA